MSNNTTTIAFNGKVTLADYAAALASYHRLMESLSEEVAREAKVNWIVESLEVSSCIATCRGETGTDDFDSIDEVIRAYETTAKSLMGHSEIPYSEKIRKAANDLASMVSTSITSIRFETDSFDGEISNAPPTSEPVFETRFGAVTGRVQSISNRQTLRFTLYDELDDHAVSCYLKPGSEDLMRESWGKIATVEGLVRRNKQTGMVSTVRQVMSVKTLEEGSYFDYRVAIGCAPSLLPNSMSPEDAIRRIRDAD